MRKTILTISWLFVLTTYIFTDELMYTVKKRTIPEYYAESMKPLNPGDRLKPSFFLAVQAILIDGLWLGYYADDNHVFQVNADAVYIENSDSFDKPLHYQFQYYIDDTIRFNYRAGWFPSYYLDALDKNNAKIILEKEPWLLGLESALDYNAYNRVWKDPRYGPAILWFHDLAIIFRDPFLDYSGLFITHLENTDNEFYRADIITDISISDSGISPTRFDNLENGGAYTLYIHHNKNRLRMYIEGQEEPTWDFFYADERFYVQIEQFPYYGTWQASEDYKNYLAPDVFEPWPMFTLSEVKAEIARRAPLEAPTHRTTSSLRLRSAQGTTGAIITTLPEGELITVLETGDTAVIDGIRAPWVRVQVRNGSRGWCFSGYLESIAKTEPVTESVFENDAEEAEIQPAYFSVSPMLQQKDKMPTYIWFAAGGAVLIAGICVIVIIALKRRKR